MKTMDPRIAERRGEVSEDRARGRLRWLLRFLVIALLVAGVSSQVVPSYRDGWPPYATTGGA